MADIVVLNSVVHGIHSRECAAILEERLDAREVALAESPREDRELIADAEIAVGLYCPPEYLQVAGNLRLFACAAAGVGHLDLEAFRENGVAVTNGSGVHGPNMAEHVLGWMLMVARRLDEGIRRQDDRRWDHFQAFGELHGSRVCVVGLGAIGEAIVERLAGFGVETVGVRYTPEKGGPTDEIYGFDDILDALVGVDYLVIACPLTDTTRGLIGEDEFATLPPSAVVVNVARGPVVDTDALVAAISRSRIHAACLDVTDPEPLPEEHPLWNLDNVFITPHNSGHTPHYWERVAEILLQNVERIDGSGEYEALENQVV